VKSSRWILLLCLVGAIVFALAPMDSSDISFGEMDTPVAVSHPALPRLRLTPPTLAPHQLSGELRQQTPQSELMLTSVHWKLKALRPTDRQKLHCVFLI